MPNLYQNDHVESDGLVFDPAQIIKRTANGVAVPPRRPLSLYSLFTNVTAGRKIARMVAVKYTKWQSLVKCYSSEASPYYQTSSTSGK